jgi:hypothetical protein
MTPEQKAKELARIFEGLAKCLHQKKSQKGILHLSHLIRVAAGLVTACHSASNRTLTNADQPYQNTLLCERFICTESNARYSTFMEFTHAELGISWQKAYWFIRLHHRLEQLKAQLPGIDELPTEEGHMRLDRIPDELLGA